MTVSALENFLGADGADGVISFMGSWSWVGAGADFLINNKANPIETRIINNILVLLISYNDQMNKVFKYSNGRLECPLFFPDATKAVVRSVDSQDVINTKTPGILVNTLHLYLDLGKRVLKKFNGIGPLMDWPGALISDSGGFQVMSLAKKWIR